MNNPRTDAPPGVVSARAFSRFARMRLPAPLALLGLLGCASRPGGSTPPDPRPIVVFEGTCDASGAVPLGGHLFALADDEDNVLRVYDAAKGGAPLHSVDLTAALGLEGKHKPLEADLEAATGLGELAFFLTSHGRTSAGKKAPGRFRFFATTRPDDGARFALVGTPYPHLLEDLLAEPSLAKFELAAAAERAPKEPGGLNIEGLTATVDQRALLIGFRNPLPGGKALLVPLENPREVIAGAHAHFGAPMLLEPRRARSPLPLGLAG